MMRALIRTIAVLSMFTASLLGQEPTTLSRAEARKIIVDRNREWGTARVAFDRPTFEKMLAPDFYVQLPEQKLSRREFIDEISAPPRSGKLTRFDVTIFTVEFALAEGKGTVYSLWVTRDRWKKFGDRWMALSSEAIGNESWRDGARPPFRDW
jgi:hypothetical protein